MSLSKKSRMFILGVLSMFIVSIIFFVNNPSKIQADDEYGHFAKKEEIIGFWEIVQWPDSMKKGMYVPWPQKYQWFGFYQDGRMFSLMTDKYEEMSAKKLEGIFKLIPANVTYTFDNGFMKVQYNDLKNYQEIWGVNILTKKMTNKAGVSILPGDIVMSLDDGKGKVIYYRQLRRLK